MTQFRPSQDARRPLKTRTAEWARKIAAFLVQRGVSPDTISLTGIFFATLGAAALFDSPRSGSPGTQAALLVAAALGVQLRLLANMLDGMVAVEGMRAGPLGGIYNELPDRVEDILLLVAAGYAASHARWEGGILLGWTACVLALLTAYIRALAAGIGAGHPFHGPMAKPHRMFLLTVGCLAAAATAWVGYSSECIYVALALMIVGTVATMVRRLRSMASVLTTSSLP